MVSRARNTILAALIPLALAACAKAESESAQEPTANAAENRPQLGLMTSLPLYWPLGADFGAFARGEAETPWQRALIERQYEIVPLDTLSPIQGLSPDDPETDPLAGLDRLAIVQPRGLAPSDNVALDEWVRGGGHLLLVLDPILSGHYETAIGDPRRPVDTALIPPVLERWGLSMRFDANQPEQAEVAVPYSASPYAVFGAGELKTSAESICRIMAQGVMARCDVGQGTVTVVSDAGMFEHELQADAKTAHPLSDLLRYALD